jgi:hypothetical protein
VFKPTVLNAVVFLLVCAMQVSNFAANYRGYPYMISFFENRVSVIDRVRDRVRDRV